MNVADVTRAPECCFQAPFQSYSSLKSEQGSAAGKAIGLSPAETALLFNSWEQEDFPCFPWTLTPSSPAFSPQQQTRQWGGSRTFYKRTEPLECSPFRCVWAGLCPCAGLLGPWNVTSLCGKRASFAREFGRYRAAPGAHTCCLSLFVETSRVLNTPGRAPALGYASHVCIVMERPFTDVPITGTWGIVRGTHAELRPTLTL